MLNLARSRSPLRVDRRRARASWALGHRVALALGWSGSCPAYTYYKYTHWWCPGEAKSSGQNQERSTCRRTRSTRSTRSTRTSTRARTRSTRSTRASTHAATPFVLVVPCAAASRRVASRPHVFSGQVQRGERRRRRRLTSCPGRVQRGERRSLGGSCRFVEVERVSGDFYSSEQGRGKRLVIHTWPRKCGPGDADVGREREGLRSPPHRAHPHVAH